MMVFKVFVTTFVFLNVLAKDIITSSENEMDLVIDMLLRNEISEYMDSVENTIEEESIDEPVYSNGVWQCGQCHDVDESRLVYTETYNVEVDDNKEGSIDLQVGLSLPKISCVIVSTGVVSELSDMQRVTGNCAGVGAMLRVVGAATFDVKVYE